MDSMNFDFTVTVYGEVKKYNDVLSLARCRIFYKYANRNGTFITDEFADKLLATVSYAPVKGIYEEPDFEGHGTSRNQGRIYGIVPENPNLKWEKHLDEDGVEREYACVDVLIFTALYEEANTIVGKSQSMELYGPSIKYHKQNFNGQNYIVYDDGCFLGLQVLGDDVEPCFEGASFYSLQEQLENTIFQLKQKIKQTGGAKAMLNFRLSDSEKYDKLFAALNPNFNEEGNWEISYMLCEIYDDYAVARTPDKFVRVYYTKDDENNEIVIGDITECFIVDVTADELKTLEAIKCINGGTYACVREELTKIDDMIAENSDLNTKLEESAALNATLTTENENLTTEIGGLKETVANLNTDVETRDAELATLKEYKYNIELQGKNDVLDSYADCLDPTILDTYRENIDNYSAIDLDKELAYELKKSNTDFFNRKTEYNYTPKPADLSGVNAILSKYENK